MESVCLFAVIWEILSFRNIITDVISNQNRNIRIGSVTVSHQNVLIQKSHSMCESVVTSVTAIHPRHRPHHRYITTLSV